jgi:hypothetical protein
MAARVGVSRHDANSASATITATSHQNLPNHHATDPATPRPGQRHQKLLKDQNVADNSYAPLVPVAADRPFDDPSPAGPLTETRTGTRHGPTSTETNEHRNGRR